MSTQAQTHTLGGKQWEYYTDMPVGEILRRARVHYGQSLNDVEAVLRIRASQLASLEEGKLDDLPGRVYAIGFVRSYSEYLGLDGDKMVHLFKIQSVGNKARPELNFPVAASESKLPGLLLLGISFAAVVLIVVLFSVFHTGSAKTAQEDIPAVSPQLKAEAQAPVTAPQPPAAPVQAPVPNLTAGVAPVAGTLPAMASAAPAPATPAKPVSRIVINVLETTWMEIRNSSGKAIISQVLNPGEQYNVPNEDGMVLATGNIGGLAFFVDGQPVPPLGNKGDVARGIKLNADAMKPKGSRAAAQPYAPATPPAAMPPSQNVPGTGGAMNTPGSATQNAAQGAVWQSAIHPNTAPAHPNTASAPAPVSPKPAPAPRRLRREDQAYRPYAMPGAVSGQIGASYPDD